jgi:hypothetical protein
MGFGVLWIDAPDEELTEFGCSQNSERRFVYIGTAIDMLPVMR